MPNVFEMADEFRAELLRQEAYAMQDIETAWQGIWSRLLNDIEALLQLTKEANTPLQQRRLIAKGSRLQELLAFADEQLQLFGTYSEQTVTQQQAQSVARATADTEAMARAFIGEGRPSVSIMFGRPNPVAISRLVGFTRTGPLSELFADFGTAGSAAVKNALIDGIARGYNPRKTARNIRNSVESITVNRARTIARTETQRAYREASRESMQENSDIVESWIWHAALAGRTCAACLAMHGTIHSIDEPMGTHPNCRCTQIPYTQSWEQLGFTGVPDTRPVVQLGEDWLAEQSPEFAKDLLGVGKYEAWSSGELSLRDFVEERNDAKWGVVRSERSLRDARRLAMRRAV